MTERKYTNRKYLDALDKKVLVFDGAMGTVGINPSLRTWKPFGLDDRIHFSGFSLTEAGL